MKKASECWCPHARYADRDFDYDMGRTDHLIATNTAATCKGSKCSQWMPMDVGPEEEAPYRSTAYGRCGLADGQVMEDA